MASGFDGRRQKCLVAENEHITSRESGYRLQAPQASRRPAEMIGRRSMAWLTELERAAFWIGVEDALAGHAFSEDLAPVNADFELCASEKRTRRNYGPADNDVDKPICVGH